MTALDRAAAAVQERGEELVEAFRGDWRALGSAHEPDLRQARSDVVAPVPPNPTTAVLKSMSLDEKVELLAA
jgi:hypothetical protein